jgi:hypothetical protein
LDVSKHTELKQLWCSGNRLTSLNINGCIKLGQQGDDVLIGYNRLSATALDGIFRALPVVTSSPTINVNGNDGRYTCNKGIATSKGWKVENFL